MSKVPAIRFEGFADPWEQRKLGEAIDISTDMVDPKAGIYDDLIHIGPGDMEPQTGQLLPGVKTVAESELISGKFHFFPGDVIYSKIRPELSKCVIAPAEGLASADAYVLHGKESIRQDFLYTLLHTEQFYDYSTSVSMRTGMPKVNREELGSYRFYAPSLPEQQDVGSFLIAFDNLITLHQRKYDQLVVLKKALLDKMFPQPGASEPEIRFEGFTDPWEQRKLDELATFGGGHTPSMADDSNYVDGEILWVTSQDVKVDYLSDTTTKLSEKGAAELKLYPAGTLLMVTRSGILRHTLPVSMLLKPSTVNQDIRTISTFDGCSSLWLMQYLKAKAKELLLEYGKTGTTVESVDFSKMKSMALMLPRADEQEAIGNLFYRLDNLITLHQRKLELLRNLKSALLNKLFV